MEELRGVSDDRFSTFLVSHMKIQGRRVVDCDWPRSQLASVTSVGARFFVAQDFAGDFHLSQKLKLVYLAQSAFGDIDLCHLRRDEMDLELSDGSID